MAVKFVKLLNFCLVILTVCESSSGIIDFCSNNTFSNTEQHMQFTKEPSYAEYAVVGSFKGIHCCAKEYRSIEWYKDGRPYPWPGTASQLIIYPESANQTIYTQAVTPGDSGNYTCLVRNDTVVYAHTMFLQVYDKVPDDPKITYISYDMEVGLGQPARLFCEAFVGRVDLPDAHNEAVWQKTGENETINDEPRVRQEKISREDGQTFGTYLIIDSLEEEDYGEYICRISKPGKTINLLVNINEKVVVIYMNPNPFPWRQMAICSVVFILVLLTLLVLNIQHGLALRVGLKDRLYNLEENDGKTNDVLVVYSRKDTDVALGVLLPTLEAKYNYKCGSRELPTTANLWCTDLAECARKSRRIIAVLSPACLNEKWDSTALYEALNHLQSLSPQLCCVALKELPKYGDQMKNSQGESLCSLLRKIRVIQWERSKDERFWLSLRLRLPPKRASGVNLDNINMTTQGKNTTRLTSDSEESLEILV